MERRNSSGERNTPPPPTKKLRLACDNCHDAKVRCSGGEECRRCVANGQSCSYSCWTRVGKPKGSKNKKTLEKTRAAAEASQDLHLFGSSSCSPEMFANVPGFTEARVVHTSPGPLETVDQQQYPISPITSDYLFGITGGNSLINFTQESRHGELDTNQGTEPEENTILVATEPSRNTSIASRSSFRTSLEPQISYSQDTCGCFEKLSVTMARLHSTTGDLHNIGLDVALKRSKEGAECCQSFLHCLTCRKTSISLLTAVLVMQLVVRSYESLVHYGEAGVTAKLDSMKVAFGTFELSGEDELNLKRSLVLHLLKGGDRTLSVLRSRLKSAQQCESEKQAQVEEQDYEYMVEKVTQLETLLRNGMGAVQSEVWGR